MKTIAILIFLFIATTSFSQSKGQFASLAIDARNGNAYGWAINYNSYSESNNRALAECEQNGGDCQIVLNFIGGCGAYVVEKGNPNLYGWGVADSRAEAERIAKKEAQAQGGKNLIVRVWGCNGESGLQEYEVSAPDIKGVFGFHFFKNDLTEKVFITQPFYQPAVAMKQGGAWVWSSDAEKKMSPRAQKFIDAVIEDLYGYLGENKDKAFTQNGLNWQGMNELKVSNSDISKESTAERKEKMNDVVKQVIKAMKNQGYEVIEIDL